MEKLGDEEKCRIKKVPAIFNTPPSPDDCLTAKKRHINTYEINPTMYSSKIKIWIKERSKPPKRNRIKKKGTSCLNVVRALCFFATYTFQ